MTHNHVCPSLWHWQEKSCLARKQILFNVYNKPAGGKGQEIYGPFCLKMQSGTKKKKQSRWSNERFLSGSFVGELLKERDREREEKEFSTGNVTFSLDYPQRQSIAIITLLVFIHYPGNLNIIHVSIPTSFSSNHYLVFSLLGFVFLCSLVNKESSSASWPRGRAVVRTMNCCSGEAQRYEESSFPFY